MARLIFLIVLLVAGVVVATRYDVGPQAEERRDLYLKQLQNDDNVPRQIRSDYSKRNGSIALGTAAWIALAVGLYSREIRSVFPGGDAPKEKAPREAEL